MIKRMLEGISVVIPAYNAEAWLVPTVARLDIALTYAHPGKAEIIIVNDGSTDNTSDVAKSLSTNFKVRVIDQENKGRFLTRKLGVEAARYEYILFLDSRVFIHKEALAYVINEQLNNPHKQVWNGHVHVAKKGNTIARFGDAITYIGWRKYFSEPRATSYGLKDFDHYPKGTGCFIAPKKVLISAIREFESKAFDLRNSSDDTHMIRIIARNYRINLSPEFSCTYHSRTKLSQFIRHTYFRGQFFVDGFLRPGNRFFVPLLVFLALCIVGLVGLIITPFIITPIIFGLFLLWAMEFIVALSLGVEVKDSVALLVLSPLFTVVYGFGIWVAVIKRFIKKLGL